MPDEATVTAELWYNLSPAARGRLLESLGLPQLVMAALDRSMMTITLRAPNADDLLEAFDA